MITIKIDILILDLVYIYFVRAGSKYGMSNFTIAILEFTDEINIISCEQKYFNRFKPEYNLNSLAFKSKGYKCTPASARSASTQTHSNWSKPMALSHLSKG